MSGGCKHPEGGTLAGMVKKYCAAIDSGARICRLEVCSSFFFFNHIVMLGGDAMLFGTDVTTSQVLVMYSIAFVFFFGLAVALVKKNS